VHRAAGFKAREAMAMSNLGRVASRAGRHEEALDLYRGAVEKLREAGAETEIAETEARIAECYAFMGDAHAALATADDALEEARTAGGMAAADALLHRVRAMSLIATGDTDGARSALQTSLEIARVRKADYEVAVTLGWIAEVARRCGEPDWRTHATAAEAILVRLGVVFSADVPLRDRLAEGRV